MDRAAKAGIIEGVRKRHGVVLDAATFTLCENAANDIVASIRHRRKIVSGRGRTESLVPSVEFYSKLVSDAANTIANQNGVSRAGLPPLIAIIVIAAIIFLLLRIHGTDFHGVQSMWETLKKFGSDF